MMTQGCGDGKSACSPSAQIKADYEYFRQRTDAKACQAGNKTYCSYAENHPVETALFGLVGFGAVGLIPAAVESITVGSAITTGTISTTFVKTANTVCGGDCSDEINTGTNTVYRVIEQGKTIYVGITNNFAQRAGYWFTKNNWDIKPIMGLNQNLSRMDARAVEQYLIDMYRLPNLENKINSIAVSNPQIYELLNRANKLLNQINFFE